MIHIEGAGIPGCLLMRKLTEYDIDFTWDDCDAKKTSWKASTGAIFPGGNIALSPDQPCYEAWMSWHAEDDIVKLFTERCTFLLEHNKPPSGGEYALHRIGTTTLNRAGEDSLHFNAQAFVGWARKHYENRRLERPAVKLPGTKLTVVSHGFGKRLHRLRWGWTRLVRLEYDDALNFDGRRPCFRLRNYSTALTYAYPRPNTPWWYSGTNLCKQHPDRARDLEPEPKYERWKRWFLRRTGGCVRIAEEGEFIVGWRPEAAEEDKNWVVLNAQERRLYLRPLWNGGIRHFPRQWSDVARALKIAVPEHERIVSP